MKSRETSRTISLRLAPEVAEAADHTGAPDSYGFLLSDLVDPEVADKFIGIVEIPDA